MSEAGEEPAQALPHSIPPKEAVALQCPPESSTASPEPPSEAASEVSPEPLPVAAPVSAPDLPASDAALASSSQVVAEVSDNQADDASLDLESLMWEQQQQRQAEQEWQHQRQEILKEEERRMVRDAELEMRKVTTEHVETMQVSPSVAFLELRVGSEIWVHGRLALCLRLDWPLVWWGFQDGEDVLYHRSFIHKPDVFSTTAPVGWVRPPAQERRISLLEDNEHLVDDTSSSSDDDNEVPMDGHPNGTHTFALHDKFSELAAGVDDGNAENGSTETRESLLTATLSKLLEMLPGLEQAVRSEVATAMSEVPRSLIQVLEQARLDTARENKQEWQERREIEERRLQEERHERHVRDEARIKAEAAAQEQTQAQAQHLAAAMQSRIEKVMEERADTDAVAMAKLVSDTSSQTATSLAETLELQKQQVQTLMQEQRQVQREQVDRLKALQTAFEGHLQSSIAKQEHPAVGDQVMVAALAAHRSRGLRAAAASGNVSRLKQLLLEGADPNFMDQGKGDQLPLALAASSGHGKCLRLLLQHGALVAPVFMSQMEDLLGSTGRPSASNRAAKANAGLESNAKRRDPVKAEREELHKTVADGSDAEPTSPILTTTTTTATTATATTATTAAICTTTTTTTSTSTSAFTSTTTTATATTTTATATTATTTTTIPTTTVSVVSTTNTSNTSTSPTTRATAFSHTFTASSSPTPELAPMDVCWLLAGAAARQQLSLPRCFPLTAVVQVRVDPVPVLMHPSLSETELELSIQTDLGRTMGARLSTPSLRVRNVKEQPGWFEGTTESFIGQPFARQSIRLRLVPRHTSEEELLTEASWDLRDVLAEDNAVMFKHVKFKLPQGQACELRVQVVFLSLHLTCSPPLPSTPSSPVLASMHTFGKSSPLLLALPALGSSSPPTSKSVDSTPRGMRGRRAQKDQRDTTRGRSADPARSQLFGVSSNSVSSSAPSSARTSSSSPILFSAFDDTVSPSLSVAASLPAPPDRVERRASASPFTKVSSLVASRTTWLKNLTKGGKKGSKKSLARRSLRDDVDVVSIEDHDPASPSE